MHHPAKADGPGGDRVRASRGGERVADGVRLFVLLLFLVVARGAV